MLLLLRNYARARERISVSASRRQCRSGVWLEEGPRVKIAITVVLFSFVTPIVLKKQFFRPAALTRSRALLTICDVSFFHFKSAVVVIILRWFLEFGMESEISSENTGEDRNATRQSNDRGFIYLTIRQTSDDSRTSKAIHDHPV